MDIANTLRSNSLRNLRRVEQVHRIDSIHEVPTARGRLQQGNAAGRDALLSEMWTLLPRGAVCRIALLFAQRARDPTLERNADTGADWNSDYLPFSKDPVAGVLRGFPGHCLAFVFAKASRLSCRGTLTPLNTQRSGEAQLLRRMSRL